MPTATIPSALCKCPSIPPSSSYNTVGMPIHLKKKKERHACKRPFHGARCQVLHHQQHEQSFAPAMGRRRVCMESGAAAALWMLLIGSEESQAKEIQVGSYLPTAPSNAGFVQFKATKKDTPALRAGNVEPYQFILPPTWKQVRVANILSGNYCQPKCAEPWVEAKFEDEKQGTVRVIASPLIRLTNKPNAQIEDIGSPEKLIASLGPFVTGNSYDPDELVESNVQKRDDQTYYRYTLETPYA